MTSLEEKIRPGSTALAVVDMQNDYVHERGALARSGLNLSPVRNIVPRVRELVGLASSSNVLLIRIRNWHTADSDTEPWLEGFARTIRAGQRAGVAGTWGADWYEGFEPEPSDLVINKTRYDAFLRTDLDERLRSLGIRSLVFCGTATNVCVESTLRSAHMRDFHAVLVEDACAAADPSQHDATVVNVRRHFGTVTQLGAVREVWLSHESPRAAT